uniref:Non-specific serine/threonine protein kinase n=1 Tax=Loa loa TaxID=7209 RepID=A0A1I7VDL0_LOALO
MLHHADCLMGLNFFAERITEQVAELAAVELGNRFRAELNPRARYFLQMRADIDSQAESASVTPSESDEEIEGKITLGLTEKGEPHLVTVPESGSSRSLSWFPLFGGGTANGDDRPRSPISFLWRTSYRQSDVSSRKSSPDGRNEFMGLLRRTSGVSSSGSDMRTKLPDSALAGLSSEEREHIGKVLSAANRRSRSTHSTPTVSRRQSIYKLPDMNDFELCERTHIEGVIEKAEKGAYPFVIKVTKADTIKEDSVDTSDKEKFDSTVNQTTNNTNEPKESADGKSRVLLETPLGSTSLSVRLDKQQNEEILGEAVPETSIMKLEQESSLDAKTDLQRSRKSEEVSCEISDAEMEHIRKVEEAAMMMGADIQWINRPSNGQKVVRNLQNATAVYSLIESKVAEELNTSESSNMNWKLEPNRKDVLTTTVFAEKMEPGKKLHAKGMIYETSEERVEDSVTSEANSMGDTNSLQKVPSLKLFVIKKDSFEEDFSKAKSATTGILQYYEGLEKLSVEEVMHNEELERRMDQLERFENPILREVMETKIVNLANEELAQIRLVNERAKELEKSDEFDVFTSEETEKYKYQEMQDICTVEEKLGQTRVAGERTKKLPKYNLLQANTLEKETNEIKSFAGWRVEETASDENLRENKDTCLPEDILICTVKGKAKHLEDSGISEGKEAEIMQNQSKKNITLTKEELMQIRAVEQQARQVKGIFIFEGQSTKDSLEKRKDSDLTTNGMAIEGKLKNHLTEEELKHIKEVEKNAIWQLEMPQMGRFSMKNDTIAEVNQAELQQNDVTLDEAAFSKFSNVLNPLKNSVITTLYFKNNVDKTKLSQNTAPAEDVFKANKQTLKEPTLAYPKNHTFETDMPTANEINHTYNTKVLVITKDLASLQTANEYPENQDSECISSSDSSNFGPGTSDEDEELNPNNVKSFDLFPETVPSTAEFKDDTGFPKVKGPSAMSDSIKNTDLPLQVIPSPIDTQHLPNSRTKVFSPQSKRISGMNPSSFTDVTQASIQLDVKENAADEQTVDRFAGLTREEIEHIKMVDLQFEIENIKDGSKVFMHNDDDSEVEDCANFIKEMIVDAKEYELQKKKSTIDVRGPEALPFISDGNKIRSDTHTGVKTIENEKDIIQNTSQIPLKRFAAHDTLLEQSVEKDLTVDQRSRSWQSAHVERDNKVKSLEELGREVDIGEWYEERLSSLRNSLCVEEAAETPGFNLKLHNVTTQKALLRFSEI